ncbi:MAG TPA: hypothetical protein VFZ97_12665 [Acidimicrobiales bacterium]
MSKSWGTRRRLTCSLVGFAAVGLIVIGSAGVALAASGGGYNPSQQDCPWNSSSQDSGTSAHNPTAGPASNPGCHNLAASVESGGATNGDPNSSNTRFVEFGNDQSPNNSKGQGESYQSFGAVFYPGDPGSKRSPHSGCVAVNTDGTNGGTGTGCGTNSAGTGFEYNYDYYSLYCPAADPVLGATGGSSDPAGVIRQFNSANGTVFFPVLYACSGTPPPPSQPTVTTGTANAVGTVLTKGLVVYFGADDNLDNGEHDGYTGLEGPCYDQYSGTTYTCHSAGAINGPSDGGGLLLLLDPMALMAPSAPTQTHPEGVANGSLGFCADSYCAEGTTQQQTVYYGCYDPSNPNDAAWTASGNDGATDSGSNATDPNTGKAYDQCAKGTPQSSNVYENDAPTQQSGWPDDCGSDSIGPQDPGSNGNGVNGGGEANCAYGSPDKGRQNTPQQINTEPGVQIYHDPDGQGAGANEGSGINLPSAYVGTCGVYANNGGGPHHYDQYNQSQFNDALAQTPLASNGQAGYIIDGNMVPGSQCGEN